MVCYMVIGSKGDGAGMVFSMVYAWHSIIWYDVWYGMVYIMKWYSIEYGVVYSME